MGDSVLDLRLGGKTVKTLVTASDRKFLVARAEAIIDDLVYGGLGSAMTPMVLLTAAAIVCERVSSSDLRHAIIEPRKAVADERKTT